MVRSCSIIIKSLLNPVFNLAEDEIWRQRVRNEEDASRQFGPNWGFLTGPQMGEEPRGYAHATAKYHYSISTGPQWTVKQIRVPDYSASAKKAALDEVRAKEAIYTLNDNSSTVGPMKNGTGGRLLGTQSTFKTLVESNTDGIRGRDDAFALRSHMSQTLGDALLMQGLSPKEKYTFPMTCSHDYGWRGKSLERFGVGHHGRKGIVGRFN